MNNSIKRSFARVLACLTLLSVSLLTSAQTVDSAITNLNVSIGEANAEQSRLESVLLSIQNLLTQIQSETETARSKVSEVQQDIVTINNQIGVIDRESSAFRIAESQSNNDGRLSIVRRDQELAAIADRAVELSQVKAELEIATLRYNSLIQLYDQLGTLVSNVDDLAPLIESITTTHRSVLNDHTEWLQSFNSFVLASRPDLTLPSDAEKFKTSIYKVNYFKGNTPSTTIVRASEALLKIEIDKALEEVNRVSGIAQGSFSQMGIGYLRDRNRLSIEEALSNLHVQINGLGLNLAKLRITTDEQAYSRHRMIDFTTVAWTRLAEQVLMASNVIGAASIINEATLSLNDNIAYSLIRSKIESREQSYKKNHRSNYAPRLARREAMITLAEVGNNLDRLEELPASYATKQEIQALLFDHKMRIDRDLIAINQDIANEEQMHFRRTNFVSRYVARYSNRLNETCKDLATDIVDGPDSGIAHEELFVTFRGSCL